MKTVWLVVVEYDFSTEYYIFDSAEKAEECAKNKDGFVVEKEVE